MGTHGVFGFLYQTIFYVVYNHWDSYPAGLGAEIAKEVEEMMATDFINEWRKRLVQLKVVKEEEKPTPEDVTALAKYTNLEVSNQSTDDWYCLLRNCQDSLNNVLDSGYILNHVDAKGQPDFDEYGYIVNLDAETLDYYKYDRKVSSTPLKEITANFAFHDPEDPEEEDDDEDDIYEENL